MTDKLLVVEDELTLADTLWYNLSRQVSEVSRAIDGPTALEVARRERPDLVVPDPMLPRIDGLEVCRGLRSEMSVPILMHTARDEEVDKIVRLELGADDKVPFGILVTACEKAE